MSKPITAKDIADLRARTGAGMMDCKKALEEAEGDTEKAIAILRTKGIAKADKRAGRAASEGRIVALAAPDGRSIALVEITGGSGAAVEALAREVAEHVAAGVPRVPLATTREEVPASFIASERAIFEAQAKESGKPDAIVQKMVDGRVSKLYGEIVLTEQPWVRDDSKTIQQRVDEVAKSVGAPLAVRRFVRFQMGEE